MGLRVDFHEKLCEVMERMLGPPMPDARKRVYFQPPESIKLSYPCIVYSRTGMDIRYAENRLYHKKNEYTVIVIDPDPDSKIPDALAELELCRFERHFVTDNLNHDVFRIFY